MQPPNPTFSHYYGHQIHRQPSQYYSYFPTQNPNPNPNPYPPHQQHQLQIEQPQYTSAFAEPGPPGAETYCRPLYPINYAGSDYNAHLASTAAYDAHYAGTVYDAQYAGTVYDTVSGAYDANQAGGLTYSQEVSAVPPNSYTAELLAQNWAEAESAQQYGSGLYASTGGTLSQDDSQQLLTTISTHSRWTNPNAQAWKKIPKKIKIAQSAWCEVCKIECNTKDMLIKHKLGRKHIKNIEKLNSIASVPATSTSAYVNPAVIGPMENPKKSTKNKAETPEELEMKRRKVLEGGASADAVRTCGICNVVCNSDTVFRFHLSGQKHASMVKKSQQIGAV